MTAARREESDAAILRLFPEDAYRTAGEIAAAAGVTTREVLAAVARLEEAGYRWERHPARGLALVERSPLLLREEVEPRLATRRLGRLLHLYRQIDSTNDALLDGAHRGGAEGTVVAAEEQRRGKGRLDREWTAPPFRALLFSMLLRPEGGAEAASRATLAVGAAVAAAVEEETGLSLAIRWPNDLYAAGRKVCGILSEYRPRGGRLVVGVGLNVNQEEAELPSEGASLRTATGRETRRGPLLARILNHAEARLDTLAASGFGSLRREVEGHSDLVGRSVTLDLGGRTIRAIATGIGPEGGLLLRTGGGEREYRVGEVTRVVSVGGAG